MLKSGKVEDRIKIDILKCRAENSRAIQCIKGVSKAGFSGAATAAAVSAVYSGFDNVCKAIDGDLTAAEAAIVTAKASGKAALQGGLFAAGNTAGTMALSKAAETMGKEALSKRIAESNSLGMIVVTGIDVCMSFKRYAQGQITGAQLGIELGEKAVGLAASMEIGAMVGGGIPGALIGAGAYMVSTAIYRGVIESIQLTLAANEVAKLMPYLIAAYNEIHEARIEMEAAFEAEEIQRRQILAHSVRLMEESLYNNDFEGMNLSLAETLSLFGRELKYKTLEEFDSDMLNNDISIII